MKSIAIISCSDETKNLIGKAAIVAELKQKFHQEILLKKSLVDSKILNNKDLNIARPTIEDIMIFFSKGEK